MVTMVTISMVAMVTISMVAMVTISMVAISMVAIMLQGGNEGADTDAEIERIKSEIELEQKNKQTLGGWTMIMFLIKIKIMCPRMDKHGAGEECEDDGEKRDGHGGHNLLLLLHPHHPKSHNPPHHHQLNQHSTLIYSKDITF